MQALHACVQTRINTTAAAAFLTCAGLSQAQWLLAQGVRRRPSALVQGACPRLPLFLLCVRLLPTHVHGA